MNRHSSGSCSVTAEGVFVAICAWAPDDRNKGARYGPSGCELGARIAVRNKNALNVAAGATPAPEATVALDPP